MTQHLAGTATGVLRQVELNGLGVPGEVRDHQERRMAVELAHQRQHTMVVGVEEAHRPPAEHVVLLAQRDQLAHPPQQRRRVGLLGLHVDVLVVVTGFDDEWQIEAVGAGGGEAGVAVRAPLHRGPDTVAVAEVHVVAETQLVAVVQDGRAGQ